MKRFHDDQRGAVSILSVLIFSIIITIVATAYIRSVTSQQRNAFNYDLSTRAYYAAESGVQDAIRALRTTPSYQTDGKTDCAPAAGGGIVGANASYGVAYTCQLINVQPSSVTGSLKPSTQNATIRLEPVANPAANPPYRVTLWWSRESAGPVLHPRAVESGLFPSNGLWNDGENVDNLAHALPRLTFINHPKTNFSRNQITQRVTYANPSATESSLIFTGSETIETQQGQLVSSAECYPSDDDIPPTADMRGFACKKVITLGSGYNLNSQAVYLRLSTLYVATDFEVELADASGAPIPLRGGTAIIDVTGRAGSNVFRRIQQQVSLGGYREDSLPDAALVAGEGICKYFSLGNTVDIYNNNPKCDPLAN